MLRTKKDKDHEYRISMEIIVDAYSGEEQAMGWYYYLDEKISFPFKAICIKATARSPLKEGKQVDVLKMAPEDECMNEMYVEIKWNDNPLYIPLIQLQPLNVNMQTNEAIEDWHYWKAQGYII